MHKDYKDKGFEILAYPCNQFGSQEPHDAEWIIDFVKKYDVQFPIMTKTSVTNKRQDPLYKWLRDNSELNGGDMQWNFEKFLFDKDGNLVKRYSRYYPTADIKKDIDGLL